jgi:serine/threonine protein kinase
VVLLGGASPRDGRRGSYFCRAAPPPSRARSKVFKARDRLTGKVVALKRMVPHHEGEGFPRTETREIKMLKSLAHPNMVRLVTVVSSLGTAEHREGRTVDGSARHSSLSAGVDVLGQSDRSGDVYMVFE